MKLPTQKSEIPQFRAGHSMFCEGCRAFRVHGFELHGNGTPGLGMACSHCKRKTEFVFVAGGWVPEPVVGTLDDFASARIDRQIIEMAQREKKAEAAVAKDAQQAPVLDRLPVKRFTCRRFLLAVVAPVSSLLLLVGALGVLAYQGVYVQPIKDLITPYWQSWMNSEWFTILPFVGSVVLFLGYLACLQAHRETDPEIEKPIVYGDPHAVEHDVLNGIGEF